MTLKEIINSIEVGNMIVTYMDASNYVKQVEGSYQVVMQDYSVIQLHEKADVDWNEFHIHPAFMPEEIFTSVEHEVSSDGEQMYLTGNKIIRYYCLLQVYNRLTLVKIDDWYGSIGDNNDDSEFLTTKGYKYFKGKFIEL